MNRFAILILGILLLCSFSLVWNYSRIQKAKAAAATNASCGDVITSDLTLDGDLLSCPGDGLTIAASNITIDGGNYSMSGSGTGSGIRIALLDDISQDPYVNVTIRNFTSISGFSIGIDLAGTSNSTVDHVVASANQTGIMLYRYMVYDLDWNEINGPESDANTISNSVFNNNTNAGIELGQSTNTVLQNNQMSGNGRNFDVRIANPVGNVDDSAYYYQDIDDTNTIEGKTLYYKDNITGTAETKITYDAASLNLGAFWCISCAYLEVNDLTAAQNNPKDVFLFDSDHVVFDEGAFVGGLTFESSTSNTLQNSSIADENLTISVGGGNIITNNDFDDAMISFASEDNRLRNNSFVNIDGVPNFFTMASTYNQDIDSSNSVDGDAMHFYSDLTGTADSPVILDGAGVDYDYLWLNNCHYVEIKNFTITSSTAAKSAIVLANSSNVVIKDSAISTKHDAAEGQRGGGGTTGIRLLNSDYTIIENNDLHYNETAIFISEASSNNIVRNNEVLHNLWYGVYLYDSDSNEISGNTIEDTYRIGLFVSGSDNTTISDNSIGYHFTNGIAIDQAISGNIVNNTLKGVRGVSSSTTENGAAIKLSSCSGLTISNNTVMNNFKAVIDDGSNTYSNNLYLNNINDRDLAFTSADFDRTVATGGEVNYDFTICVDCSATVRTSPEETITTNNSGTRIRGAFSPSKPGLYGLVVEATKGTDITRKKYNVYVDSVENSSRMYLRDVLPSHGQVQAWGQNDGRALLNTLPESDESVEVWYCGGWIQNSPDEIPNYPLANLKKVIIDSYYKGARAGVMGIERYNTYNYLVDAAMPHFHVSAVAGAETGTYAHLSGETPAFNYPMDNPSDWYMLSIKYDTDSSPEVTPEDVVSHGPHWKTTRSDPSFVDFVSDKTVNPAIKSISNPDVNVVSATNSGDGADLESATLVLDGLGASDITIDDLERPFLGYSTTINSVDGTATLQAVDISGETSISTVEMNVVPSAGAVVVNVSDWSSSEDYYRRWTENSENHETTVSHNIGGFKPSTSYSLKINGTWQENIVSDENGDLSFDYDGGFSEKTFEILEDTTPPSVTLTGLTINRASGYIDIEGTASDDSGSGIASITVNGRQVDLGNLPNFNYRLLNLIIGSNSIELFATDAAGNDSLHLSFSAIYIPIVQPNDDSASSQPATLVPGNAPIPITYTTEPEDNSISDVISVPPAASYQDDTPVSQDSLPRENTEEKDNIIILLVAIAFAVLVIGIVLIKKKRSRG